VSLAVGWVTGKVKLKLFTLPGSRRMLSDTTHKLLYSWGTRGEAGGGGGVHSNWYMEGI